MNGPTAGTCIEITPDVSNRDATRARPHFNLTGDSINRLASRTGMRSHIGLLGYDDLIADRNVSLCIPIVKPTDTDRLAGLFDRRIRFDPPNHILRIAGVSKPVF